MLIRILLLIALCAASVGTGAAPVLLNVRPGGDDASAKGPFASVAGARDAIRAMRAAGSIDGPVRVVIESGEYPVAEPLVLLPEDSGTADSPVTYESAQGASVVIHGGRAISGWHAEGPLWVADVPAVREGTWSFSQLFVNGERRTPARTPNANHPAGDFPDEDDLLLTVGPVMEKDAAGKESKSATRFYYRPGDVKAWPSLQDAIVVVYHSWETALLRPKSIDESANILEFTGPTNWGFGYWHPDQRYYIEHLFEALDQPGEWFLNKREGRLYYMPMPGEAIEGFHAVAPVAGQLLRIEGAPEAGRFVEHLNFSGLKFHYTEFAVKPEGHSDGQAAASVPAAVEITGGRHLTLDQCEIAHTGTYGLWFRRGSQDNLITRSEIFDLGAGGVRIGEGASPASPAEATERNVVDNCFIHDGGRVFRGAVGAWIGRSSYNRLSHNEICDFRYTGISVGWSWGYDESSAHHNIIEYNRVHNIAKGQLSDTGGIYTLGVSPGTIIRNNVFHDVLSNPKVSGGWGIYFDEGSTGILAENNLVYNTRTGTLHQHYGRDNRVVNNIFAYSHNGQLIRSREEDLNSFFFERNIVLFNNNQLLGSTWKNGNFKLDSNVYWSTLPEVVEPGDMDFAGRTWEAWRAEGHDRYSLIADPRFIDPASGDFRLREDSPALTLGFKPFDFGEAGLYGDTAWVEKPRKISRPAFQPPVPPRPVEVADTYEDVTPGNVAAQGVANEEGAGTVRVSADTAREGRNSLKFSDAPGLGLSYNPHHFYTPGLRTGLAQVNFSIRLDPGAVFYHEWRDGRNPYQTGPSLWFRDGKLVAGGKDLMDLPAGEWIDLEVRCLLGRQAEGTYALTVTVPGAEAKHFEGLPCGVPGFNRLDWMGFVSNATDAVHVYVDDVRARTLAPDSVR